MTKATWPPEDQAWLDAHHGEGLPPVVYGTHGMGGYAHTVGPSSHPVLPEPDDPTPEEIARAMNGHFVPCSALKGAKIAREIKRRELEAAGAEVARVYGGDPATLSPQRLRALANIHAVGTGT